ncbi:MULTISPECIES: redox-sensing transcriptional repressor Rex [Clostridium]|jgi:redox-sensing transcriptional repressor|uniref:Redox-sensing transcriptional repressor Rex n=1 Tax=Clostridium saccharoperbutylacetonicum N1-4(HMT) TaxID=931276 RepID=M1LN94_9CLOT|nr:MULTISPECIES: redox-sensing transcriptional repressor Rex [Clostridium]AGF54250.1 redox-sensing transcriptional repressor Rex [Clostridium saccharoperbutylacetonicum N1-4(HMT)]AQR93167.1 redox-sensing transcriptional repressor Rex [Clostridium saccharoperbutylacetonicum]NRT59234.1 redox-sensing transcriptional repressor [Clostridium saccharoperbutylacetonicum]NSB28423.1 redox-sensing transcriptional repressor [Clostridium saccharoperbutylacetonicum]NSB34584.1 redox-sensing transcriptional r
MDKSRNISMAVIKRLPKYYRYLEELMKNDVDRISSKELGEKIGFTASQIRQDLNCFGDFGQQGYGYNVKELYNQISSILGLDRGYQAALVGAGNIGQAVSNYSRFENLGFKITSIFDANPKLIGMRIRDVEIKDIDDMSTVLQERKIDIGIICVPRKNAQVVADELIKGGVRAIWNFAPVDLVVPDHVKVENVHLSESLLTLIYLLNESDN